jgi:hypothetical protein
MVGHNAFRATRGAASRFRVFQSTRATPSRSSSATRSSRIVGWGKCDSSSDVLRAPDLLGTYRSRGVGKMGGAVKGPLTRPRPVDGGRPTLFDRVLSL